MFLTSKLCSSFCEKSCNNIPSLQLCHFVVHKTHEVAEPVMVVQQPMVEEVAYDNHVFIQEEMPPVVEEKRMIHEVHEQRTVIEHDPIHVQYAIAHQRSPSPKIIESSSYEHVEYRREYEEDEDAIVVELKDDKQAVYDPVDDDEYRIETEVVQERM